MSTEKGANEQEEGVVLLERKGAIAVMTLSLRCPSATNRPGREEKTGSSPASAQPLPSRSALRSFPATVFSSRAMRAGFRWSQ